MYTPYRPGLQRGCARSLFVTDLRPQTSDLRPQTSDYIVALQIPFSKILVAKEDYLGQSSSYYSYIHVRPSQNRRNWIGIKVRACDNNNRCSDWVTKWFDIIPYSTGGGNRGGGRGGSGNRAPSGGVF